MKVYRVGGCVRDFILGKKPKDYDYVVVGSTAEHMVSLGYKCVGNGFPVFLHPETGDEYALARTEAMKSVNGFEFVTEEVSLEKDLLRRDLTINAMALDDDDNIIDPYGGCRDLAEQTLRPVSDAFMEDPLRILRVARFRATLGGHWQLAPSLLVYARAMNYSKIPKERIYKEASKAMLSEKPSVFFRTLQELGVLNKIYPQLYQMIWVEHNNPYHMEGSVFNHTMMVLDMAVTPEARWAALFHDVGKVPCKALTGSFNGHSDIQWCDAELQIIAGYGLSRKELQVVRYVMLEHHRWQHFIDGSMSDKKMLKLLLSIRDAAFLRNILHAVYADMQGRYGVKKPIKYPLSVVMYLWSELKDYKVDCTDLTVGQIKQKVHSEKLRLLRELLKEFE